MNKTNESNGTSQRQEQKIEQTIELKASSDAPKCPLGHPTAALYFKRELNPETGMWEVSWKCALAATIDDKFGDRLGALKLAKCPAAETASVDQRSEGLIFKKTIRTIRCMCKLYTGKWIQDI